MDRAVGFEKLRDGSAPLYVQIASIMRRRMRSGEWPVGMQLPTLEQLAEQLGVARVTVRQAMDLLESERLIWRRQGKGTFVTAHATGRHWMSVAAEWDELVRMIEGTEVKVLETFDTEQRPRIEEGDGQPAEAYRYMRRLHSHKGEPHLLIEIHLARDVYRRARKDLERTPVIPVMSRMRDLHLGPAHQTLTVGSADPEVAAHLHIALGEPVVEVRRIIQDASGRIIYFGYLNYRADTFRLEMVLRR